MKTITEQLIAEKELLSDPARWTKSAFARDANGRVTMTSARAWLDDIDVLPAVCWCQHGASYQLSSSINTRLLKNMIANTYGFSTAMDFNDAPETTHADLMSFYDVCIAHSTQD